jgi:hypothetical protein
MVERAELGVDVALLGFEIGLLLAGRLVEFHFEPDCASVAQHQNEVGPSGQHALGDEDADDALTRTAVWHRDQQGVAGRDGLTEKAHHELLELGLQVALRRGRRRQLKRRLGAAGLSGFLD